MTLHQSRRVVLGFACLLPCLPIRAYALSIVDLKGLADAVDAAAKSMATLGDSIAHDAALVDNAISVLGARSAETRLTDIESRLQQLTQVSNSSLLAGFRGYIELWKQRATEAQLGSFWTGVLSELKDVVSATAELLADLKKEKSQFVLEDSYGLLLNALSSKVGLFDRLQWAGAPSNDEQITELSVVADKFDLLRVETIRATKAMAAYIKSRGR